MPLFSETALARRERIAPATSDILCEGCGYTLNGLPEDSRCPECGKPIVESIGSGRRLTAWDRKRSLGAFLNTSASAILRPTRFYRALVTRASLESAKSFAAIYWAASSILFTVAAVAHAQWYLGLLGGGGRNRLHWALALAPMVFVVTLAMLNLTTRLAARLTTWEASYRGYRLPIEVVLRGMYYHAAHYLPVAAVACATVLGFIAALDRGLLGPQHLTTYLYVLSAEVVLAAGYLFSTYWTGMRNMMYANQ